jgi:intracellular multiplication protein IcmP
VSQQKSPHEDFLMTFFAAFVIGGVLFIIWYLFQVELKSLLRWIRVGQLNLVSLIYSDSVGLPVYGDSAKVGIWRKWLPRANPDTDIDFMAIKVMTGLAVLPMRYFYIGALGILALVVMFKGPGTYYRRRMGLEGLMQEQAKSFPTIAPFLKFDPRKLPFRAPGQPVPSQLPMFSEALSPEEWLAYHQVRYSAGQLDTGRAYQALALQLGKRWQGPKKLPLHMQGLYAAFALKHVRKRKQSEDLLNAMSLCWTPEGGFKPSSKLTSEIRKVVNDPKVGGAIQKYADQHAYETTAMLRCLQRAREEGGVLAPAQFVWLRGHDRTLWYPLNNLGRKSYHAEASGALVHYTNEMIAGQRIPTPRFEEVIKGFEGYMKTGGKVIPELDKKAGGTNYWKK